jgi:hypothetical protein
VKLFDQLKRAAVLVPVKAKPCGWPQKARPALTGPARDGFESCGRGLRMLAARIEQKPSSPGCAASGQPIWYSIIGQGPRVHSGLCETSHVGGNASIPGSVRHSRTCNRGLVANCGVSHEGKCYACGGRYGADRTTCNRRQIFCVSLFWETDRSGNEQ